MVRILYSFLILLCFASCSQYPKLSTSNIKKGYKKTEALINNLTKKGNQVFSITSTYSTESLVWTHQEEALILYTVNKDGIDNKTLHYGSKLKLDSLGIFGGYDSRFPYALDGDIISFSESGNSKKSIPIDINLFVQTDFPDEYILANQFKKDILFIYSALGRYFQ